jgi:hypothetical protein
MRSRAPRPGKRGISHQAARNHEPTQTPVNGPSRNNPTHVTWWSQPSMIVHATAQAPSTVHAKSLKGGRRYAQKTAGDANA